MNLSCFENYAAFLFFDLHCTPSWDCVGKDLMSDSKAKIGRETALTSPDGMLLIGEPELAPDWALEVTASQGQPPILFLLPKSTKRRNQNDKRVREHLKRVGLRGMGVRHASSLLDLAVERFLQMI